jgi:voltage-gated potassium channel
MNSSNNKSKALFDKFIGALIFLNILHQVISSMDLTEYQSMLSYGEIFFQISMVIFLVEFLYRLIDERRLGFLNTMDGLVLINYFLIGILDLRIFRLFRFFDIFSKTRILLPSNTLFKTIHVQRHSLLGSLFLVLSVLLLFSTIMYFVEREAQPEKFGSIPLAIWWGMETLTTVGYGDVHPITPLGKVLGTLTMLLGIGMFALPAAILGSAYYEEMQKRNFLVTFEAILEVPLFEELPIKALSKINEKLDAVLLPPNEAVFEKGEEADSMYIIESGRAQVELENPIVLEPGDYFGEMGLINNNPRNATITTLEEVKLLQLKKEDLEELFDEHPVLFQAIEAKLEAINS